MNDWPVSQPQNHNGCEQHLIDAMNEQGVQIDVAPTPQETRGPFHSEGYTCPHGTDYWIIPTESQMLEWSVRGIA